MKFFYKLKTAILISAIFGMACFHSIDADAARKRRPTAAEIAAAEEAEQERQATYNKAVDSNQIENWPQGPQIYAEAGIVMEADTGTILYNKDMDTAYFPASITKMMTALLTVENCSLDETVTYSYYATHSLEAGSSSIGTKEGEQLSVEESLYALLLESANECGNGLAEHIAGSVEAFADMMNTRAQELGCTNTHFVNPHGLPDDNHYTTPHDMALITQAALQNENFVRICGTARYDMGPTNKDEEPTYMRNHHYMINNYQGVTKYLDDTVIAGKTGYTNAARGTLVTVAERNGMTLIVVTMKTASTGEKGAPLFSDTALLLDYAAENFSRLNVAANETNFSIDNSNFFHMGSSIFGQSNPLIEIDKNDSIILPNDVPFPEASPELIFTDNSNPDIIATLSYTYQGQHVGSASILLLKSDVQEFSFDKNTGEDEEADSKKNETTPKKFIRINIRMVLAAVLVLIAAFLLFLIIRGIKKIFHLTIHLPRRKRRRRARKRKRSNLTFKNNHRRLLRDDTESSSELDL